MDVRWFGQSFFELNVDTEIKKGVKIYFDPYADHIGLKPPSDLNADVVLISHDHPDHNNLKVFNNSGVVISTPGEYSIQGVDIKGILTYHDDKSGEAYGPNVAYILDVEGIRVVHLGDIGHIPDDAQTQKIDGVDILMLPVGGVHSVNAKDAVKIVKQLEPKVVIPMHYKVPGIKVEMGDLDTFCKEMGICAAEAVKKLSLKAGSLMGKEMEVIVMEP